VKTRCGFYIRVHSKKARGEARKAATLAGGGTKIGAFAGKFACLLGAEEQQQLIIFNASFSPN